MTIFHKARKQIKNSIFSLTFFILILFLLSSGTVLAANLNSVDNSKITNKQIAEQALYSSKGTIRIDEKSESPKEVRKKLPSKDENDKDITNQELGKSITKEVRVIDSKAGGNTLSELKKYNGKLKIIMKDETTQKVLSGAAFELFNDKNQAVYTLITNEKGEAITDNIPSGTYTLKERKAPIGYKKNTESQKLCLDFKKNIEIEEGITNKRLSGKVKILKVDKNNSNKTLEGAEFTLKGISYNNEDISLKGKTNKNGILEFGDLLSGRYILRETKAPKGYEIEEKEQERKIEIEAKTETAKFIIKNKKTKPKFEIQPARGKFKIIKQDEITGELLKRAVFELVNDKNEVVMTLITNEDGEAAAKNIPGGTYTLREIMAPAGYKINLENNKIHLNFEKNKVIEKVITNKKIKPWVPVDPIKGTIKVVKVSKANSSKVLEGAEFELKGISENNKDVNLKGTTNKEGILEFKDLLSGKYTLTETKAPKGYRIDEKEQEVEIKSQGEVVEVKVKNEKIKSTSGSGGGSGSRRGSSSSSGSSSGTVKPKPENPEEPQKPKKTEPENPPTNKEDESPSSKIEDHGKENNKLPLDENKVDKKKTNAQKEIKPDKNINLLPKTGEDSSIFNYIFGVILITIGFYLRKNK